MSSLVASDRDFPGTAPVKKMESSIIAKINERENREREKANKKPLHRLDEFGYVREDDDFLSSEIEAGGAVDTVPPESFRRHSFMGVPPLRPPSMRDIYKNKETPSPDSKVNKLRLMKIESSVSSPDNKSRDNILFLAKSFRTKPSILSPKSSFYGSSSSSGHGNSDRNLNIRVSYDYSIKVLPVKLPTPRMLRTESFSVLNNDTINFFSPNGKYYTNTITTDSRDGKGYGRRIRIAPRIEKESFLNHRQGVVISLKRKRRELLRNSQHEKGVGRLIEKFRDLSPQDYDHMIIHHFGFEKIYSISDSVLQEYNPNPSIKSPYRNKNARFAFENDGKYEKIEGERTKQVNQAYIPSSTPYKSTSNDFAATFPTSVNVKVLKKEHEQTERDQSSSQRTTSVKQIAREKRFLTELFLPLLNEKLKPEILDFIKEEVTMQLNLKICDLYEDDELSITDEDTFQKALGAYLRSEKLVKTLQEARDSLLSFVKENMP